MMTVQQVSQRTGISVRTLHHYDQIGLLKPTEVTEAGYRLYDDAALERLQHILLFRELQFPLRDIKAILDSPSFDRNKALDQQIALLEMRREHLNNLILLARGIRLTGVKTVNFEAFDTKKIDEYAARAKASWGNTPAYKEFEQKSKGRTQEDDQRLEKEMWEILSGFQEMLDLPPEDEKPQAQVKRLQEYLTANFYNCTKPILSTLGKMYAGGGAMTENIERICGKGTAESIARAIEIYCK